MSYFRNSPKNYQPKNRRKRRNLRRTQKDSPCLGLTSPRGAHGWINVGGGDRTRISHGFTYYGLKRFTLERIDGGLPTRLSIH